MSASRVLRVSSVTALAAGLFGIVLASGLEAASKQEEAKKYHEQLKTAKDPKKKAEALDELGKIGQIMVSLTKPAIPDMMKALEDKDVTVRKAAAEAVGKCEPDPEAAVPALTKLLKDDKSDDVKISAARGLMYMGDAAKNAVDDLKTVAKAGKKSDGKQTALGRAAGEALRAINGKRK